MAQTGKLYFPLFLPSILLYSKWKNQESTYHDANCGMIWLHISHYGNYRNLLPQFLAKIS